MGTNFQHTIIGYIILVGLYFGLKHFNKLPELTYLQIAVILVITYWYSNFADVDQPGSIINQSFIVIACCIIIWAFVENQKEIGITMAVLMIVFRLLAHRTLAHSLFFGAMLSAPLWFVSPYFAIVAFIMYTVHITSEGELSVFSDHDLRAINFFGRQEE